MADKERKDKLMPKPNYQMWIILALVAVILAVTYFNRSGDLVEIQSSRFEDMVQRKDIKKIVVVKKEDLVEITLKPEALQNAVYKQELESNRPLGINANGPHYKMSISTIDQFVGNYQEITKNIPDRKSVV